MKAIAIQPIWNHLTQKVIDKDRTFDMPDEAVNSLVFIGAAKLPEKEKTESVKTDKQI